MYHKKSIHALQEEVAESGAHSLKRTLGPVNLIALGVGTIIGIGLFTVTGTAAANNAGPAITISFIIAAIGCALAGLCYAEFASMIPVAGSAYTYAYTTLGEFIAWIIGWDLVLEYALGAAIVAISWSKYLIRLLATLHVYFPSQWTMSPFEKITLPNGQVISGIMDLPAMLVVIVLSLLLRRGTKESATVNNLFVVLKMFIVFIFIVLGWSFINTKNYVPYIPENTGVFGEYGFSGILRAAGIIFLSYVGFDAISTAAQEVKNPKKDLPIGILCSLLICTVIYVLFSSVMTGDVNYKELKGPDELAPVANAIAHMGNPGPNGLIIPAYPWLNKTILIAIIAGFTSAILVMMLGQCRIFYSMSKDGLLPKVFSEVHPKYRTPAKSTMLFMVFVSLFSAFAPVHIVGEMISIGTLFAFVLVCIGILVLRKKVPDAPRHFKTPFVPYVPIAGALICLLMMSSLPLSTWIRLLAWMLVGFDIYLFYGMKNSALFDNNPINFIKNGKKVALIGIGLAVLLIVIAQIYHLNAGAHDAEFFLFSMGLAVLHLAVYSYRVVRLNRLIH